MHNKRCRLASAQHADEVREVNPGLTSPADLADRRAVPGSCLSRKRLLALRFVKGIVEDLPKVRWRRSGLLDSIRLVHCTEVPLWEAKQQSVLNLLDHSSWKLNLLVLRQDARHLDLNGTPQALDQIQCGVAFLFLACDHQVIYMSKKKHPHFLSLELVLS